MTTTPVAASNLAPDATNHRRSPRDGGNSGDLLQPLHASVDLLPILQGMTANPAAAGRYVHPIRQTGESVHRTKQSAARQ
jgi:hypothetical protein